MTETYYAIRIGDPRRHHSYLWCGEDGRIPLLFLDKSEAVKAHNDGFEKASSNKVVRVRIKCQ